MISTTTKKKLMKSNNNLPKLEAPKTVTAGIGTLSTHLYIRVLVNICQLGLCVCR